MSLLLFTLLFIFQESIKPGMKVEYWGLARGSKGTKFSIHSIDKSYVICDPPKAKNLQSVPKKDFQQVWELWKDYILGEVQRQFIRDEITRYSSYIISIYKHLDLL